MEPPERERSSQHCCNAQVQLTCKTTSGLECFDLFDVVFSNKMISVWPFQQNGNFRDSSLSHVRASESVARLSASPIDSTQPRGSCFRYRRLSQFEFNHFFGTAIAVGGDTSGRPLRHITVLAILLLGAPLQAAAQTAAPPTQNSDLGSLICPIIETVARTNALPVDFFTRVIWQESRLRPDAIGPVTRTGERALGMAQFMPSTAATRRLYEPFNPVEALPKSGEFLAELRDEFGNLGLAAAAYNAGAQRVHDFVAGSRDLPAETRNYVLAITGHAVEAWKKATKKATNTGNNDLPRGDRVAVHCRDVIALLKQTATPLAEWERHVPSWCEHLYHPNVSVCGRIHQSDLGTTISSVTTARSNSSVLKAATR